MSSDGALKRKRQQEDATKKDTIDKEKQNQKCLNEPIVLNVGGTRFETTRATLCSLSDTMLSSRFGPDSTLVSEDSKGTHFIDADPDVFRVILRGLRHGYVLSAPPAHLDMDQYEWQAVLQFYGLNEYITKEPEQEPEPTKKEEVPLNKRYCDTFDGLVDDFARWLEHSQPFAFDGDILRKSISMMFGEVEFYPRPDGDQVSKVSVNRFILERKLHGGLKSFEDALRTRLGVNRLEIDELRWSEGALVDNHGKVLTTAARTNNNVNLLTAAAGTDKLCIIKVVFE